METETSKIKKINNGIGTRDLIWDSGIGILVCVHYNVIIGLVVFSVLITLDQILFAVQNKE